ncbi:MAG TPA: hypothetical protein VKV30_11425 [Candidatus Angelobacter sp.]|nr:hypothetical protein [Candidatus Angelobacter sp.]
MGLQHSTFSSQPKQTESKIVDEKLHGFWNVALARQILRFRSGFRLAARTPPEQLKMYYFAIDFEREMSYPLTPPQGWEAQDRSLIT